MKKKLIKHNINTYRASIRALFKTHNVQYIFVARNAPHRAIAVSNVSGNYQLHAVDFRTGFHRQITNIQHGALFGSISSDGQYVYVLDDIKGAEHGHFVRTSFKKRGGIDLTPGLKDYFSYSVSVSHDEKTFYFTATLNNKNNVFVVRRSKNDKYKTHKLYDTRNSLSEPVCAPDGSLACVAETNADTNKSHLVFLPVAGGNVKYSRSFNAIMPLAFSNIKSRNTLLMLVRYGEWYRPAFYDVASGSIMMVNHPSFLGDIWVLSWDEERHNLVLCDIYHAEQKLYLYNTFTKHLKRIGPKKGSFNFHFGSLASRSNNSIIIRWSDFNTSPRLINIHGPQYNTWSKISKWSGNISSDYKVESVWIKSSDGECVQMWVVRPRGVTKPIPFVIDIHGGPHGVVLDEFSPKAYIWLKNGFGFCAINYRGSIGFGKKFERKIYGNPGHWEVEDVVAARNWLVRNKFADPKHVTLYGWSWGGYVTLLALGKYPKLWSSAIAGAAIADCVMQYEDEPAYFRAQDKEIFKGTPKSAYAHYIRSSPITYIENIQAPVLLLHGKNDVRCPPRQIRHFIDVLKKNNKPFGVEWFESGHIGGFTDTDLRIKLIDKTIKFALKYVKK